MRPRFSTSTSSRWISAGRRSSAVFASPTVSRSVSALRVSAVFWRSPATTGGPSPPTRAMQHAAEATTDALTGLANRREFNNRLATIPRGEMYVLLSMDVDGLKQLNDRAGHAAGDELLRGVAKALRRSVRDS